MGRPKGSKDKEPRARRTPRRAEAVIPAADPPPLPVASPEVNVDPLRTMPPSVIPAVPPLAPLPVSEPPLVAMRAAEAPEGWQTVLELVDQVQEALGSAREELAPHLAAMDQLREYRAVLLQLGEAVLEARRRGTLQLSPELAVLVESAEQLRLTSTAGKDAALAMAMDSMDNAEGTQVHTDKLP